MHYSAHTLKKVGGLQQLNLDKTFDLCPSKCTKIWNREKGEKPLVHKVHSSFVFFSFSFMCIAICLIANHIVAIEIESKMKK